MSKKDKRPQIDPRGQKKAGALIAVNAVIYVIAVILTLTGQMYGLVIVLYPIGLLAVLCMLTGEKWAFVYYAVMTVINSIFGVLSTVCLIPLLVLSILSKQVLEPIALPGLSLGCALFVLHIATTLLMKKDPDIRAYFDTMKEIKTSRKGRKAK